MQREIEYTQQHYLNNDFRTCLHQLFQHGYRASPRGTSTWELLNYNITLVNPRNRVITFPERKTSTKYLLGEFIWYLSGSNDPKGILPYAKFWDSIRNPNGTINSNYGHRLFGHAAYLPGEEYTAYPAALASVFPMSQWNETASILKKDKDSRQAIMNIHVPPDRWTGNKDVPCTLTLQWFIRENKLHLIVNMRSNDIVLGFTNDVFQFTMMQEAMMLQLRETYPDLELGHYYHNTGSMHIYDRHFEMAKKIIATPNAVDMQMAPMDRFDDEVLTMLVGAEAAWQVAGAPEDFDFNAVPAFRSLTPYWQNLVNGFFLSDDEALHAVFNMPEA